MLEVVQGKKRNSLTIILDLAKKFAYFIIRRKLSLCKKYGLWKSEVKDVSDCACPLNDQWLYLSSCLLKELTYLLIINLKPGGLYYGVNPHWRKLWIYSYITVLEMYNDLTKEPYWSIFQPRLVTSRSDVLLAHFCLWKCIIDTCIQVN